jgi:serine O-acetyltransferase
MRFSLPVEDIERLLLGQLQLYDMRVDSRRVVPCVKTAFERFEHCAKHIALPGFQRDGSVYFNHLHGDQSAMLLYLCANAAWRVGDEDLAQAFFLVNKARNGLVCMYDTALPDVFLLNHTVGTVLGKATYGEFFVAYHGVTVGTEWQDRPVLGTGVILYPRASVIGSSNIGDRVIVSTGSIARNLNVKSDHIVVPDEPRIRPRTHDFIARYFHLP